MIVSFQLDEFRTGNLGCEEATVFRSHVPITSPTDEERRCVYCGQNVRYVALHKGAGDCEAIWGR